MKLTLTPEDRQRFEALLGRREPPPDTQAFEDLLKELETTQPEIVTQLRDAIRVIGVPSALQIQGSKAKEEAKFAQIVKNLFYKKTADGFVQDKAKITRTALVCVAVLLSVGALGAVLKPADSSGLSLSTIAGGSGDPALMPKVTKNAAVIAKPVSNKDSTSSGEVDFPDAAGSSTANGSETPATDPAGTSIPVENATGLTAPQTVNYDVPSSQPDTISGGNSGGYGSNEVRPREIGSRPTVNAGGFGTARALPPRATATSRTSTTPARVVKTAPRITCRGSKSRFAPGATMMLFCA